MGLKTRAVHVGHTKESVAMTGQRLAVQRRDAAIGNAIIVNVLIGNPRLPARGQFERDVGVHRVALAVEEIAVVVQFLVEGVQAECRAFGNGRVHVGSDFPCAKRVDADLAAHEEAVGGGCLLDTIDNAAAAAPTEDEGIRAFQDLDAFDVIEVPKILDVVAHTIEEEVGGGVLPAQRDLVTIAFALADGDARDVAKDIRKTSMCLVLDLFASYGVDRLGYVDKRCIGLGCRSRVNGEIAIGLANDEDCIAAFVARLTSECGPGQGQRRGRNH